MLNASPSSPAANFFAKVNGLSGSSEATKEDGDAWTGGLGRPSIETGGGTDESGRQPGDVRRAVSLRVQGSLGGFRPLREPIGMSFGAAGSNLSASPLSTTTGSTTLRSSSSSYAPPAASRHPLFSHHASPPIRPFEDQDGMSEATLSGISTPPSPSGSVGSSGFSPASAFLSHFSSSGSLRSNSTETAIDAQGARVLDYTLGKLIGRGGFSAVRKAHHVVTGEVFACKIVKRDDLSDSSGSVEKFEEEIRIWQAFPKHPSILPLLEMHRTPTVTFLIVPFLPGGSLLDVLKRENGSDRTARKFFPGVVTAVSALHEGYPGFEGKLLHGDLKLDNFLVDHVGNVIVGDFYTAKSLLHPESSATSTPHPPHTPHHSATVPLPAQPTGSHYSNIPHKFRYARNSEAGLPKEIDGLPHPVLPSASLPYAPPELLRAPPSPPSLAQDIWAVGIVLHALLTGRLPFFDAYDPRLQMKILKGTYAEPEHLGKEWLECLRGCLDVNRDTRWDIARVKDSDAVIGWQEVRARRSKSRSRSRQRVPQHRDGSAQPMAIRRSRAHSRASPAHGGSDPHSLDHTPQNTHPIPVPQSAQHPPSISHSRSPNASRSRSNGRGAQQGIFDLHDTTPPSDDLAHLSIARGRPGRPIQKQSFEEFPPISSPSFFPSPGSIGPSNHPVDALRGYQPGASRNRSTSRTGDQSIYHPPERSQSRGYDADRSDPSTSRSRTSLSPSTSTRGSRSGSRSRNRNFNMSQGPGGMARDDSWDSYDYENGSGLHVVREEGKGQEDRGRSRGRLER